MNPTNVLKVKVPGEEGVCPQKKGDVTLYFITSEKFSERCQTQIDKTAVKDLIWDDKGKKIGQTHAGLHKSVKKLIKEDPHVCNKTFLTLKGLNQILID